MYAQILPLWRSVPCPQPWHRLCSVLLCTYAGRLSRLPLFCAAPFRGWFGLWLGVLKAEAMNFSPLKLCLPYISVFAVTWLFACLSFALSMILPSRSAAAMISGIIVLAGYIITTLSKAIKGLETWALFSPITYFQSNAMTGLNFNLLSVLVVASLLFVAFARRGFGKRDIRVAGDGGWKIPLLGSR